MAEPDGLIGGKYRILSELGKGAMGVVYRAEHLDVEGTPLREIALKTIRPELSADPAFARRFLHEVRVATRLRNPWIVTVFDSGRSGDGQLYFTMELVQAPTLKEVLASEGALSPDRVARIAIQICEALTESHGLTPPVVHRDLKPGNVFLERRFDQDWVKVADFGIAKVLGEEGAGLTATDSAIGTPLYMAPEQWQGGAVDGRTDLYALGVMMFELLTASPPFTGRPETLMYHHLREPAPALPESLPREIRSIVAALLAKDPGERPADAGVVRRALAAALEGSEQHTLRLPGEAGAPPTTEHGRAGVRPGDVWPPAAVGRPRRTRFALLRGAALAVVALLAVVTFLQQGWHRRAGDPIAGGASDPRPFATAPREPTPRDSSPPGPASPASSATAFAPTASSPVPEPPTATTPADEVIATPAGEAPATAMAAAGAGRTPARSPGADVSRERLSIEECSTQTFSAGDGPWERYEWSIDGSEHPETGREIAWLAERPGEHLVRLVTFAGADRRLREWAVEVEARPPSREEIERWVTDYREALVGKDVAGLLLLGAVDGDEQERSLRERLARLRDYEVTISNLEVTLASDGARVRLERSERWKDPDNPSFVLNFEADSFRLVRRDCRLVSSG